MTQKDSQQDDHPGAARPPETDAPRQIAATDQDDRADQADADHVAEAEGGGNRPSAAEDQRLEPQRADAQHLEPHRAEPEPLRQSDHIPLREPPSDDTLGGAAGEFPNPDVREVPTGEVPAIHADANPATEPDAVSATEPNSSVAEQVATHPSEAFANFYEAQSEDVPDAAFAGDAAVGADDDGRIESLSSDWRRLEDDAGLALADPSGETNATTESGDTDAAPRETRIDPVPVDASAPEIATDHDDDMGSGLLPERSPKSGADDASVEMLVGRGDAQSVSDAAARAEIVHHHETDGASGEEASVPIVVRTGWASPPPLTTRPSWVVRDIEPDIVPSERVADADGDASDSEMPESLPAPGPQEDVSEGGRAVSDASPQREAEPIFEVEPTSGAKPAADVDAEPDAELFGWRQELARAAVADKTSEAPGPDETSATETNLSQPDVGADLPPPLPSRFAVPEARQLEAVSIAPADPVALSGRDDIAPSPEALTPLLPRQSEAPMAPPDYNGWPSSDLRQSMHAQASSAATADYDEADGADDSRWDRAKTYARRALRYAGYGIAGYFAFVFVLILLYRVINPPFSSLMAVQALTGTDVHQEWVALEDISPALVRAVIVSEDWSFCEHYGIDIKAIEQAIERSGNGIPRGASTISMQTTKNLFLWNAKSYVRKAVEVPLTLMIELIWPKWRILEIYLNVAEWGPGVFGAEAAAQYHFNKPASRLGEREAAQLAASLPNPIIREAGDPGPRTARKASVIQSRMRNAAGAATCVLGKR